MTLRNGDTIELICFVTHIKYQIDQRRTFPSFRKPRGRWSWQWTLWLWYRTYTMASQWFKCFHLGERFGLGLRLRLNIPSRLFWWACIIKSLCLIMHAVQYLTTGFNNARLIMNSCIFNFRQIGQLCTPAYLISC